MLRESPWSQMNRINVEFRLWFLGWMYRERMQGRQIFVQKLGRNQERLLREDTFDAVVDLKKKKKSTMWEFWVTFDLRQNEDSSPGRSISDSSEIPPQRGKRDVGKCMILVEGEVHAPEHTCCRRSLLVSWRSLLVSRSSYHWRILVLFSIRGDARIGLSKSSPANVLTVWTPVLPVFPERRAPPSWSPPRAPFRGCWGPAPAVAHDSIRVEVDGKCQPPGHTM